MDFLKSSGFESNGTTELVRDLTCSLASYREENVPLFPDVFLFPSVAVVTSISPGTQRVFLGNTSLTTGADNQRPYLITNQNEFNARFSPDGRWVAYASDETGRFELYIQSFPELSRGIRISANGGYRPEWRKDGKELYYIAPDDNLMAVVVNGEGPLFPASPPRSLFHFNPGGDLARQQYQPTADGARFLINSRVEDAAPQALTVLLNWRALVKK